MMPAPMIARSARILVMQNFRGNRTGRQHPPRSIVASIPGFEGAMDRFRRAVPAATLVDVTVDGQTLRLPEGEMLAAALLASGTLAFSTSIIAGEKRGPYCLMGTCFQCAATV